MNIISKSIGCVLLIVLCEKNENSVVILLTARSQNTANYHITVLNGNKEKFVFAYCWDTLCFSAAPSMLVKKIYHEQTSSRCLPCTLLLEYKKLGVKLMIQMTQLFPQESLENYCVGWVFLQFSCFMRREEMDELQGASKQAWSQMHSLTCISVTQTWVVVLLIIYVRRVGLLQTRVTDESLAQLGVLAMPLLGIRIFMNQVPKAILKGNSSWKTHIMINSFD